jgi:hypothetical protein
MTIEDAEREPITWFAELEMAHDQGDMERAARAIRRLKELGIEVKDRRGSRRRRRAAINGE